MKPQFSKIMNMSKFYTGFTFFLRSLPQTPPPSKKNNNKKCCSCRIILSSDLNNVPVLVVCLFQYSTICVSKSWMFSGDCVHVWGGPECKDRLLKYICIIFGWLFNEYLASECAICLAKMFLVHARWEVILFCVFVFSVIFLYDL